MTFVKGLAEQKIIETGDGESMCSRI